MSPSTIDEGIHSRLPASSDVERDSRLRCDEILEMLGDYRIFSLSGFRFCSTLRKQGSTLLFLNTFVLPSHEPLVPRSQTHFESFIVE